MNGRRIIDLLLYSNVWIALAAVAMSLQTQWLLFGHLKWDPLWPFIFFSTVALYALHRLMALRRVEPFQKEGRFETIYRLRYRTGIYGAIAAGATLWFFLLLQEPVQRSLIIPAVISLGYVLPVARGGRRLRDLNHLKIFLLSATWAWVTVGLPAANYHWALTAPALLMAAERALFIFAIALPFDIRDLPVDAFTELKTLPARLGPARTKLLAAAALLGMMGFSYLNFQLDVYSPGTFLALALSAASTYALIFFSDRPHHDYYFTGLMDGTMIVQFALVCWLG